ncbi:MAG: hypothetical protein V8Q91_06055 [Bilophila wadsworthia]
MSMGTAARDTRNTLVRFVSSIFCHRASSMSATGSRRLMPALLTRICRPFPASLMVCMALSICALSVTSKVRPRTATLGYFPASSPAARHNRAVDVGQEDIDLWAIASAMARPMPRPEPVTRAVLPFRENMIASLP